MAELYENPVNTLIDEVSPTVTYVGKADLNVNTNEAFWQIIKVTPTSVMYPQKDNLQSAEYEFVWDNRATYTYSN